MIAAVLSGLAACVTERRPYEPEPGPYPVREVRRWDVVRAGEVVGAMLLREIQHPDGAVRGYYVRNAAGQWLGYFDRDGRVFQRVPFLTTEAPWGMHTMQDGLGILFEQVGPYVIRTMAEDGQPEPASALPAAGRRPARGKDGGGGR